jgi:hypothetical protein
MLSGINGHLPEVSGLDTSMSPDDAKRFCSDTWSSVDCALFEHFNASIWATLRADTLRETHVSTRFTRHVTVFVGVLRYSISQGYSLYDVHDPDSKTNVLYPNMHVLAAPSGALLWCMRPCISNERTRRPCVNETLTPTTSTSSRSGCCDIFETSLELTRANNHRSVVTQATDAEIGTTNAICVVSVYTRGHWMERLLIRMWSRCCLCCLDAQ